MGRRKLLRHLIDSCFKRCVVSFLSVSASRALGNNFKRVIGFMCGLIRDVVRALCINRAPPQLKALARAGRWIHGSRYEQLQRARCRRSVYYCQYGKFQASVRSFGVSLFDYVLLLAVEVSHCDPIAYFTNVSAKAVARSTTARWLPRLPPCD